MLKLLLLALVGFFAQLVSGVLGMGYGVTVTSLLLVLGTSPAIASATVHLAEIGTHFAVGASHWKLGNVDWRLVLRLGLPGAIGAFAGALLLSRLSTKAAAPAMAGILLALGVYVITRYSVRPPATARSRVSPHGKAFLVPLGLLGGFVDATGGGGWGPITTTSLLSAARTSPRTVVGSVDAAKFLVAVAATLGFVFGLGFHQVSLGIVLAILIGGVLAAPVAAVLVAHIPIECLGVAVGGLIIFVNARVLLDAAGASTDVQLGVHALILAGWAALVAGSVRGLRRRRSTALAEAVAS